MSDHPNACGESGCHCSGSGSGSGPEHANCACGCDCPRCWECAQNADDCEC
ncbi:hypothetical protein ACFWFS_00370 [Streptomyces albidoflavus]